MDDQRIISPEKRLGEGDEIERSLRPPSLAEFTGQEDLKESLSIAIEAAKRRGDALDHCLFSGPPGLGKTTLAGIIAKEMGVNIHSTSGPVLEKASDLAGLLTSLQENDILFIDEIHRLNRVVEEYLYPAMEDFRLDIMLDSGPAARSVNLPLKHFTLVGATTRSGLLTSPLRDRFGLLAADPRQLVAADILMQTNAYNDVKRTDGFSWQKDAYDHTRAFRARFPAWAQEYEQKAQSDTNMPPFTKEQQALMESIWKVIREELRANGVDVLDFKKISKVDELMSKKLFGDIKDLLQPQMIGLDQPLPFLWNGETNIVAFLGRGTEQKLCFIPLHRIPAYQSFEIDGCQKIVITAQLIRHFLPLLLKKENIRQSAIVEVTRNADVFLEDVAERANEDLRLKVSTMITKRKREMPVRVCIFGKLSNANRALLIKKIRVPEDNVFNQSVPFDLSFRSCIGEHENFKYQECRPSRDIGLKKGEYFSYIEKHDLLISFPFKSMVPFVDLIYEAADDPESSPSRSHSIECQPAAKSPQPWPMPPIRAKTFCAFLNSAHALTSRTTSTIPRCWRMQAAA